MHNLKLSVPLNVTWLIVLTLMVVLAPAARSQTYQVIHRFSGGADSAIPMTGLTMDRAGNLYGTTRGYNGATQYGTLFKLTHSGSSWVLSQVYVFQGGADGAGPESRVIIGSDGSLYGSTGSGGAGGACNGYGCGTVFNLRPPLTACRSVLCPWIKTNLHSFSGTDGSGPVGDLIFDGAGNLFGATYYGGKQYNDDGVVYQLTPSNGGWTETVLYNFHLYSLHNPRAGVTLDQTGNLYGTTFEGDEGKYGAVYELTPSGAEWAENTLYSFDGGVDGGGPYAGVIFDDAGNLYGATPYFGAGLGGTVFKLTPLNGSWGFAVLYGFASPGGSQGPGPQANLVMDKSGNLYGTTYADGAYGLGSVFKLAPGPSGWTYTSLHDFTGPEGAYPVSSVTIDANGNLYGTASKGARQDGCGGGCGVVWEITP